MKNILGFWAAMALTVVCNAKVAQCTAADGTVLRGQIREGSMIAELTNISIKKANQPIFNYPESVKGAIYTDITNDPNKSIVLAIYNDAENDPDKMRMYGVRTAVEGQQDKGNVLEDSSSGTSQPVICVELAE